MVQKIEIVKIAISSKIQKSFRRYGTTVLIFDQLHFSFFSQGVAKIQPYKSLRLRILGYTMLRHRLITELFAR